METPAQPPSSSGSPLAAVQVPRFLGDFRMETLAALSSTYCSLQKSMQSYGCLWVAICGRSARCQYSRGSWSVLESWCCRSCSCTFRSYCGDSPNKDGAANVSSATEGRGRLHQALLFFKSQLGDFLDAFFCLHGLY